MLNTVPGLVSTIIPVFNRPQGLRDAVESVLAQRYRPIEIVIVDDGSTDETAATARELAAGATDCVQVVTQRNCGPGVARESGLRVARGEFVQYLDSDDVILPGKFELQVRALRADRNAAIAYGWTRLRAADGTIHPQPWKGSAEVRSRLFPSIVVERWWDTPNPLYRASACEGAGPWLPLSQEEDWEYDFRLGARGARLAHVAEYVCEIRDHGDHRLSGAGHRPERLRDRAVAQAAMFDHARCAGLDRASPEGHAFARRLFLLARQCGAAGLATESKKLFELARAASSDDSRRGIDFLLYRLAAGALGWANAGRLACWSDRFRGRRIEA